MKQRVNANQLFAVQVFGDLPIGKRQECFVRISLESAATHSVPSVQIRIELICRRVAAFSAFFPTDGKYIVAAFEKGAKAVEV